MLRLPDGLRDKIKESAEQNNRSMNAEIIAGLEDWLSRPDQDEQEAKDLRTAADMMMKERMVIEHRLEEILHRLDQMDRKKTATKK